jgi:hypothetical protein
VRYLAAAALAATLVTACGDGYGDDVRAGEPPARRAPPDRQADIAGPVAAVSPARAGGGDCPERPPDDVVSSRDPAPCDAGAPGSLRIDEGRGAYDAASVTVDEASAVLRRTDAGYEEAALADLRPGDLAEVWFDGPVAESYPVQARAGTLVIAP